MDGQYNRTTLFTTQQAADYCGVTPRFFEAARLRGDGPRYIRLSRRAVRYRSEDLEAWLDARRYSSTAEELSA